MSQQRIPRQSKRPHSTGADLLLIGAGMCAMLAGALSSLDELASLACGVCAVLLALLAVWF